MPARGAIGDPPHLRRAGSDALRRNGDDAINALQCGAMPGVRELKQHRRRIKSAAGNAQSMSHLRGYLPEVSAMRQASAQS